MWELPKIQKKLIECEVDNIFFFENGKGIDFRINCGDEPEVGFLNCLVRVHIPESSREKPIGEIEEEAKNFAISYFKEVAKNL